MIDSPPDRQKRGRRGDQAVCAISKNIQHLNGLLYYKGIVQIWQIEKKVLPGIAGDF